MLYCNTKLDNCNLSFSFWLAGRNERPEWEVRLKDDTDIDIIEKKEIKDV